MNSLVLILALGLLGMIASSDATENPLTERLSQLKAKADTNGDGEISESEKVTMRKLIIGGRGTSKGILPPRLDIEEK